MCIRDRTSVAAATESVSGGQKPIMLSVQGSDLKELQRISKEISDGMHKIDGLVDIESSLKDNKSTVAVQLNREAASDAGLSVASIGQALRPLLAGEAVTTWQDSQGENYDVRVRLPDSDRREISDLSGLSFASTHKNLVIIARLSVGKKKSYCMPKNIFYNTGIPTYIWIVSNKKAPKRKGQVQLINAMEMYEKLRKNLGQKNCEMKPAHIDDITQLYMDFVESDISKIYPNEYFGYYKITVERPLRLSAQFTPQAIATLRFDKNIAEEMEWAYAHFGDDLYKDIKKYQDKIEAHLSKNEVKLKPADKTKLLSAVHWKKQLELMQAAQKIADKLGNTLSLIHISEPTRPY